MPKAFTQWHEVKSHLESEESKIHFYEREVWLASLGANIGREEDGKHEKFLRPIIIVKKFNRDQFWGVPLTSTIKSYPHYYPIEIDGRKVSALLHQIRSLDRKRLLRSRGIIAEADFIQIRERSRVFSYRKAKPLAGRGFATYE